MLQSVPSQLEAASNYKLLPFTDAKMHNVVIDAIEATLVQFARSPM